MWLSDSDLLIKGNCRKEYPKKWILVLKSTKKVTIKTELTEHSFTFDYIYDKSCTQTEFYEYSAQPGVFEVLKGFNTTVFAYGQTGAGKSWSMMGDANSEENKGIIPRANEYAFIPPISPFIYDMFNLPVYR